MRRSAPHVASKTLANIATALRARREELGLTQDGLSNASGISRLRINKLERGGAENVLLSSIIRLAAGVELDLLDLLEGLAISRPTPVNQDPSARLLGNLQRLRQHFGLSQEDLSVRSGHYRAYINRLEGLRIDPSLSALERIAEALDVSTVELFYPLSTEESEPRVARKKKHVAKENVIQAKQVSREFEHIAALIRGRREELGLAQDTAAKMCHVSRSALVHLEQKAATNPRFSTLVRLADGLHLEIQNLLDPDDGTRHAHTKQDASIRLAVNLRRLRKAAALSQIDLSLKSGHFKTYVNKLELLRTDTTLDSLYRVAKELEVRPWELLKPVSNSEHEELLEKHIESQILR